jgi:hypothetical protein
LGETQTYRAGLAELLKQPELRLLRSSDDLRPNSDFDLPWNVLFSGLQRIDGEQLVALIDRAAEGHRDLYRHLMLVFQEVLATTGIDVVELRTAPAPPS